MEIVQSDKDPQGVLRAIAQPVPLADIPSPRIQGIIERMKTALASQDDGVAIAAPQIGESLRIFVVSGKVFTENGLDPEEGAARTAPRSPDLVFINPEIVKLSRRKALLEEGCLSCRWWYGEIERSTQAKVRAWSETGREFTMGGSGLLAQIFQHETDHLNGILFIDNAVNLEEIAPDHTTTL